MKRLLLLAVLSSSFAYAQKTQLQIFQGINSEIRLKPAYNANRNAAILDTLNASFVNVTGLYSNPSWITSLAGSKITGAISGTISWSSVTSTPTTLFGYGITDAQPLNSKLTSISGLTISDDDFLQQKAGAITNRTVAQVKTDLGVPASFADYVKWGSNTMTTNTTIDPNGKSLDIGTNISALAPSIWYVDNLRLEGSQSGGLLEIHDDAVSGNGYINIQTQNGLSALKIGYQPGGFGLTLNSGSNPIIGLGTTGELYFLLGSGNNGDRLTLVDASSGLTEWQPDSGSTGDFIKKNDTTELRHPTRIFMGTEDNDGERFSIESHWTYQGDLIPSTAFLNFGGEDDGGPNVGGYAQFGIRGDNDDGKIVIKALQNDLADYSYKLLIEDTRQGGLNSGLEYLIEPQDPTDMSVMNRVYNDNRYATPSSVLASKTYTGKQTFFTSTGGQASINIPNGSTPAVPANGDIWGQGNHLWMRLNGVTYQMDQQGGGTVTGVTLTQPSAGFTLTNSGSNQTGAVSSTFALANDLSALEGLSSTGFAARTTTDTWAQRTITGTTNQIDVSNGNGVSGNPTLSMSATYVGQTSITTLGIIGIGTWNASLVTGQYGGTGVANTGKTITVSGNTIIGSSTNSVTLNTTGNTSITLPQSGTLSIVGNPLSQFASTTSSQLAGVLSDETGTGNVVFSASPAFTATPTTPTAASGTNTTQIASTAFVTAAINALPAYPLTTDYDLWTQISGSPSRIGIGSANQVLAVNGAGTSIGWATVTTAAWPLTGTGTFTGAVTIAQANNTLDYTSTLGISSSSVFQQITNSSNVLYQLTTQGFPTFNLYSTSAKIGSVLFISTGGAGSGIRFQDATATTRYNILQNVTGDYLSIAENTVTSTKVSVGMGSGVTPSATFQVRGRGTTTGAGLVVENSTGTGIISSTDGGDIRLNGKVFLGGSTAAVAWIEAAAGTTTVAPLKINSGTLLTTPVAGVFGEFDGTNFYASPSTTRKRIPLSNNATPSNGQLLIGNATDFTVASLTAGSNITITPGSGSITIASAGSIGGSTGSVDNSMLRSDGTGGATLQSSVVIVDDNGNIILGNSTVTGGRTIKPAGSTIGTFEVQGQDGSASAGGDIELIGGIGVGTNQNGGNALVNGGLPSGTGTRGNIIMNAPNASFNGGVRVAFMGDRTTAPSSAPSGGYYNYSESTRPVVWTSDGRFDLIPDVKTITTSTTLDQTYNVVLVDATSGAVTVTLPAASSNNRREYVVIKIDSSINAVTILCSGTDKLSGSSSKMINTQYAGFGIKGNGALYYIVSSF